MNKMARTKALRGTKEFYLYAAIAWLFYKYFDAARKSDLMKTAFWTSCVQELITGTLYEKVLAVFPNTCPARDSIRAPETLYASFAKMISDDVKKADSLCDKIQRIFPGEDLLKFRLELIKSFSEKKPKKNSTSTTSSTSSTQQLLSGSSADSLIEESTANSQDVEDVADQSEHGDVEEETDLRMAEDQVSKGSGNESGNGRKQVCDEQGIFGRPKQRKCDQLDEEPESFRRDKEQQEGHQSAEHARTEVQKENVLRPQVTNYAQLESEDDMDVDETNASSRCGLTFYRSDLRNQFEEPPEFLRSEHDRPEPQHEEDRLIQQSATSDRRSFAAASHHFRQLEDLHPLAFGNDHLEWENASDFFGGNRTSNTQWNYDRSGVHGQFNETQQSLRSVLPRPWQQDVVGRLSENEPNPEEEADYSQRANVQNQWGEVDPHRSFQNRSGNMLDTSGRIETTGHRRTNNRMNQLQYEEYPESTGLRRLQDFESNGRRNATTGVSLQRQASPGGFNFQTVHDCVFVQCSAPTVAGYNMTQRASEGLAVLHTMHRN